MPPKGKTPSLIGGSLGRPVHATAGKRCPCSRCKGYILKGSACFDVPQPSKTFNSPRRFCVECFASVLAETRTDLDALQALLATPPESDQL